ncbi:MAG: DNA/RNA nuclease SfsA [Promethearchaeota archaeon]
MLIAKNPIKAIFKERINKFLVKVTLENDTETLAYLPDPGRLLELLHPGITVYLKRVSKAGRKTSHDMIAVKHDDILVSVDCRVPNILVRELLINDQLFNLKFDVVKPEYKYGKSRLDFYCSIDGDKYLLEVKSVTLVEDLIAKFPDAPTKRGARHLQELIAAVQEGFNSMLVLVIQREDARSFQPNWKMDPDFSRVLLNAVEKGVKVKCFSTKIHVDKDGSLNIIPLENKILMDFNPPE